MLKKIILKNKSSDNNVSWGSANHVNEFYQLKKKFKFFLIEDACHAIGSNYIINKKKYNVGSSTHSDLCVFSLHAIKTITTGEGGIICTNNKLLFDKIISLKSHGIKRDIKKDIGNMM